MWHAKLISIDTSGLIVQYYSEDNSGVNDIYSLDQFQSRTEFLAFVTNRLSNISTRDSFISNKVSVFMSNIGGSIGFNIA